MRKVLLLALMASFLVTVPAGAATQTAPPANSALSQYLEVVPGSKGNTPAKGGSNQGALGAKARAELKDRGDIGESLAGFVDKTAPEATTKAKAKAKSAADSEAPDSKVNALAAGVTGGSPGSMGIWLPILIVAALALAIFAGYRQRSARSQ